MKVAVHEADSGYVAGDAPLPRYKGLKGLLLRLFVTLKPTTFTPDIILKDGDSSITSPASTFRSYARQYRFLDQVTKRSLPVTHCESDGKSVSEGRPGHSGPVRSAGFHS